MSGVMYGRITMTIPILTENEKKTPICFECAKSLGLVFDRFLEGTFGKCGFCDESKFTVMPTDAVNL